MIKGDEKKPIIRLIGIGMDGGATLTEAARTAVEEADAVFGAKRVTEPFAALEKPIFNTWKAAEIAEIIKRGKFGFSCVMMSGDCGFYSAAERLVRELSEFGVEVIPGISSPVYFAAKLKIPWQDWRFISMHGVKRGFIRDVCRNYRCFFLLGGEFTPNTVCRRLCEYGLSDLRVYIGENLAYTGEKISLGTAAEFVGAEISPLSVMLVENPNYERGARFGIEDGEFVRGSVPMTKSEVRSVVMSKLQVGVESVCWDIGCGTGSVTVEMALCGGVVYALDTDEEAAELTRKNALRFRCDNVSVKLGGAPEALGGLPSPDCVFIGGSGGRLEEIIETVFKAAKGGARIVVTAVTLNTLECARRSLAELGAVSDTVQIAVTRIGAGTMLAAQNPIFIISSTKGE